MRARWALGAGTAVAAAAAGLACALLLAGGTPAGSTAVLPSPHVPGSTGGVLLGRPLAVPPDLSPGAAAGVARARQRTVVIHYRAWDGKLRRAFVLLPAWYGPRHDPPIPLVISPHGRGVPAAGNVHFWGHLAAVGGFAVVNPEGQGRRLVLYSWGDPGEIDDLARMPQIVQAALPWLHVDLHRVYSVGGSMGGQETLLLAAKFPHLLAGAISFDAPTDLAARFRAFPEISFGRHLQKLAFLEIGGSPWQDPRAYAVRSPIEYARRLAQGGVPLQIWWSWNDRIVVAQQTQSGKLYEEIERWNPQAPVAEFVGTWGHTREMFWNRRLAGALALFGLMPPYRSHSPGLEPGPSAPSQGAGPLGAAAA